MNVTVDGNAQWKTLANATNVTWGGNQEVKKFIFDVDGTLTPSWKKITLDFFDEFFQFTEENDVYLVTGSDRDKTLEQITPEIFHLCKRVYNCSGSDVYEGDINVYRDDWE